MNAFIQGFNQVRRHYIKIHWVLKGKVSQNYNWIMSERIWKTEQFDANFIEIGYLLLKLLRLYVFKMAAIGGCHFEIIIKI